MTTMTSRTAPAPAARERAGKAYEKAKALAAHADPEVRRGLAAQDDTHLEILYFLAGDESPVVRREIAANAHTPRHADRVLAEDVDDEVRCEIASKIGRLVPRLSAEAKDQIQRLTFEILDILAHDQLPRVRQIVAEEIRRCDSVPRRIIFDLARDIELIVAAPVLEYSPLLGDDDLLEIIASEPVQGALSAIARRESVEAPVTDAIAGADDSDAIAALLANKSAQIREETLDKLIDGAPKAESWHRPLVERPELSLRAIRRIATFVALALLRVLEDRHDLPPEAAKHVRAAVSRRIGQSGVDGSMNSSLDADDAFAAGSLDDESIVAAVEKGERDFAVKGLALMSELPQDVVQRILDSRSAKSVTALVWSAGLSMRTAIQVQLKLARVPPTAVLNAKNGVDYPLTPDELKLHLDLFDH